MVVKNVSHNSTNLNGTQSSQTSSDYFKYPFFAIVIFGIFGNILVILSILRQRCLLKSNYYFCVFQLAICDLGIVLIVFLELVNLHIATDLVFFNPLIYCLVSNIVFLFQIGGICMMLIISVLRYRATVHPLKPSISRRKLTAICTLVYIIGLVAGYGTYTPSCFLHGHTAASLDIFLDGYLIIFFYILPTLLMAVVYYKIGRAIVKQNEDLTRICSNRLTADSASSFNISRYSRNRRTFFVCLITVLCYGIGNLPISVWFIWRIAGKHHLQMKYIWFHQLSFILKIAGSYSINPLIYGILDKKMLAFWKLCPKPLSGNRQTDVARPGLVSRGEMQVTPL